RKAGHPGARTARTAGGTCGRFRAGWHPPAGQPSEQATPDDVALILHTSGTTSRPKMVPLTHRNLTASALHIRSTLSLGPADRCLNVMPLFHIHGLIGALLSSLSAGGSVFCAPGFQAPLFLGWMREYQPTWHTAVPTMQQAILSRAENADEEFLPPSLRFIRSSSSALPPQVAARLEEVFHVPVIESYGMTEAAHQMASNPLPPGDELLGSALRAAPQPCRDLDPAAGGGRCRSQAGHPDPQCRLGAQERLLDAIRGWLTGPCCSEIPA
ncbi:MAG TPA: AMP-binding protein, partial [Bryobacteraceae bacterium]|nr:AMP-binding protein [Bryobacteraceae bacterium]